MRRCASVLLVVVMGGLAGCSGGDDGGKVCVPSCDGRECGPDGCGGTCGSCPGEEGVCTSEGQCTYGHDDTMQPGPPDLGLPPNATVAEKCERIAELFAQEVAAAAECETVLDCRHVVANRLPCTCSAFVADKGVEDILEPLVTEYKALDCLADELCEVCPFTEVPGCVDRVCGTVQPTCADLAAAWSEALAQAVTCSVAKDCSSLVPPEPGCTCSVPATVAASVPFFDRAAEFADIHGCEPVGGCLCGEGEPVCIDGKCGWK